MITDKGKQTVAVLGEGSAILSRGRGAYSSGSTIRFKLEKSCPLPAVGRVRFSIDYRL